MIKAQIKTNAAFEAKRKPPRLIDQKSPKKIKIGVVHQMTALGYDELDQDIRMAHRQNYRRLAIKLRVQTFLKFKGYPSVEIVHVFVVKESRDGETNVGFEDQFRDILLGRHFENVLWSDELFERMHDVAKSRVDIALLLLLFFCKTIKTEALEN
ncbi:Oidioi.mRNA.OKI2018_I69.chr1.g1808.t1.cds [Oikopleura dioica]|uniref:Oidioi.mRNA.OKI2018_I69.chr1.g1808.t1.cds n=1 Tax=Oikopleura dioica TaxID=34765 RepID=A0ABN7SP31_OIKDI|nr:Oidioi.mRNA.OKI2018_I69.chr1.g1808.t1.cds [Oikopleura dioica]